MIGNNDFLLNEATMIEAVAYWLNNKMLAHGNAVEVKSVDQRSEGYSKCFAVAVEPKKAGTDPL